MTDTTLVLPEGAAPIQDVEASDEPVLVVEPDGQAQAFPADKFSLDVPKVDGLRADKIIVTFAGSVELNITDENDLAMFNALTLGKEVDLRIAGVVADRLSPVTTDKESGEQKMARKAKVSVHTVYVLSPEDLT